MDSDYLVDELERAANPLDRQRALMMLLSHKTRHQIIQVILGYPAYLASEAELAYIIANQPEKTVTDQIPVLIKAGVLAEYRLESNKSIPNCPWTFYGLTEYGVEILRAFNYLKGVPFAQAVYEKTRKNSEIERHGNAPRPPLSDAVEDAVTTNIRSGTYMCRYSESFYQRIRYYCTQQC